MHSIDAAYCDRCGLCLYVGVLVKRMKCAKTPEPIEIPFGAESCGSPRNHVLD